MDIKTYCKNLGYRANLIDLKDPITFKLYHREEFKSIKLCPYFCRPFLGITIERTLFKIVNCKPRWLILKDVYQSPFRLALIIFYKLFFWNFQIRILAFQVLREYKSTIWYDIAKILIPDTSLIPFLTNLLHPNNVSESYE